MDALEEIRSHKIFGRPLTLPPLILRASELTVLPF